LKRSTKEARKKECTKGTKRKKKGRQSKILGFGSKTEARDDNMGSMRVREVEGTRCEKRKKRIKVVGGEGEKLGHKKKRWTREGALAETENVHGVWR